MSGNEIVFSTLEGMEEDMRIYWASITPMQRLINLNRMIILSFGLTGDRLEHAELSNEIKIISPDDYIS